MIEFFKSITTYKPKEAINYFLSLELDDITKEIKEHYEIIKNLEAKRNRVELIIFGN